MTAHEHEDLAPTEGLPTRSGLPAASEGSLPPGARLGRYRVDSLLGRGGMGEVYRAEQLEPVHRTVALKLLNVRRLDARHLAYFEVERQLLAQMKHPAIAQVFDAGATPEGYPFFVMEFIEGSALTSFCESRRLPLRERLELFIRVCEGVQHAHQKGVIHRDLKPGNILVAEVDGRPLPKIIDFGIATAASRSLAAGEHLGELERAGTPDYMSPEQAGLEPGAEVDTRSDVYSLGVLLYELLAGRRPGVGVDTDRAAHTASTTLRPPSEQIETLAPGNVDARANQLGLSRPRLRRLLRSELDWVVLKAMRRDRAQRYDSAAALAEDLRRFLDDRPLDAVPRSRRYSLGKYLRRHRVGFAAGVAVALAVLAGLGLSLYGLRQANLQREIAETRSAELERVAAFQQSMLEGIDIEAMGVGLSNGLRAQLEKSAPDKLPLLEQALASASPPDLARGLVNRDILAGAQRAIDRDFADQPALAANLRQSVAQVQMALGLPAEAEPLFAQVADYLANTRGDADPDTLAARNLQSEAMAQAGKPQDALALVEKTLMHAGGGAGHDDVRLDAERQQAGLVFTLGDRPRARAMQQALYDREKARRAADDPKLLVLQDDLGLSMGRMGDIEEARAIFEALYKQRLAALGPEDETTLNTMGRLAVMRAMDGDPEEAVVLQRQRAEISARKLGAEHPATLAERGNLANMLLDLRQYDEAEALMRSVLEARQRLLGPDATTTLRSKLNLASLLAHRHRFDESLAMEAELLEARRRILGPRHPDTVFLEVNHAATLHRAGRGADEVQAQLERARPLAIELLGEKHPQVHTANMIQSLTWIRLGRHADAITQLRALRADSEREREADEPPNARVGWALAVALRRDGQADEAAKIEASDVQWLLAIPEDKRTPEEQGAFDVLAEERKRLGEPG
ncbi:serine/threonine-protein kinase [Arenimonas terrae]|uniref:Serine/threonine protein kinase n=1 Tax=Arenimonas terrae TaxID=2546226 RepID=A0A5C4RVH9_9GAMM|nr:serine/threonine-protein kinase [Arenimonas terrae]TNJ34919.1 serine/threonine protein kinase [Arenimonas terrae]